LRDCPRIQNSDRPYLVNAVILIGIQATDGQISKSDSEQLATNKQNVRLLFETVWNETHFVGLEKIWSSVVVFHFRGRTRVGFSGSHTGEDWFGLPATGNEMNGTEMMFFRFENGRVVEAWEDYDEYVMRRQLGALP
jgi:predicted ester cyclase